MHRLFILPCSLAFCILLSAPPAKASDTIVPLVEYLEKHELSDKGVHYYLSVRCASLHAYFAALMQDRDANAAKGFTDSAMGLLEVAALNSYQDTNDMEKSFNYAKNTLGEMFDVYNSMSKKHYNLSGSYITPTIDSDMEICKVIAESALSK